MPVLAIDVGERRIGVAVSDPGETFALPLETIQRSALRVDLDAIVTLAKDHGAATIVVGDPLTLKGERGIASQKMDAFVAALRKAFEGNVETIDERMTTALVSRRLVAGDVSRGKRKQIVDRLAAAAILETYLARKRNR